MTSEYRGPQLAREDDELSRELRAIYAPPPHANYWATLETRIMARVYAGATAGMWWSVPDSWLRAGLLAAGLAVAVAGSLLIRRSVGRYRHRCDGRIPRHGHARLKQRAVVGAILGGDAQRHRFQALESR